MDVVATGHPPYPLSGSWNLWPLIGLLLFFVLSRWIVGLRLRAWLVLPALIAGEIFSDGVHRIGIVPTTALSLLFAVLGSLVRRRSIAG